MSRILPQLPPEIIIDILSRLPVKPLFRLKCVCKSWLSLISNNPQFAKLHLHYAKQDTTVNRYRLFLSTFPFLCIDPDAFCNGDNNVSRELINSRIPTQPSEFRFIGSCNGLIAIFFYVEPLCFNTNPYLQYILVWNPTTGDFRELPPLDSRTTDEIFFGFGYDSHIDDYKLVRGVSSTSGSEIKIEVLNLKENEWRSSQDVHTNFSLRSSYISTNGILHWLVELQEEPDPKSGIVSFDLGKEKFLEMVLVPDNITKKLPGLTIEGVGDDVWVCTKSEWNVQCCEGWIMKRNGREISWRKLYSLGRDILPECECEDYWIHVIWVGKNGNVVLDVDGYELVLYNLEEQSSLYYGLNNRGFKGMAYMETLISPNAT